MTPNPYQYLLDQGYHYYSIEHRFTSDTHPQNTFAKTRARTPELAVEDLEKNYAEHSLEVAKLVIVEVKQIEYTEL